MHHHLDRSVSHTRWNNELAPRLTIAPGDTVTMEMRDSSDAQVHPGMDVAGYAKIDRDRIHALTGPVAVEGAEPGDVLTVEIVDIQHEGWAWTSLVPGLGLLENHFPELYLKIWKLEGDVTQSIVGTTLDLAPFCGVMGVAPVHAGEHRTRPPCVFGGNMDVRHLTKGAVLRLPVQVPGALFSAGDAHAAQGDGEVCINGMEAPMIGTFKFGLEKGVSLKAPEAMVPGKLVSDRYAAKPWKVFIESGQDFKPLCQKVVLRAIEYIVGCIGCSEQEAYILCSVALDLKVSQLVNVPTMTISGYLPEAIFD